MRKYLHQYLMITLGCIIMGIAYNTFYVPHKLLSGGLSSISMILYYLFSIPMGFTSLLMNVPLFFLAHKYMTTNYLFSTAYGTIAFSACLDIFHFLSETSVLHDTLLSCLAGGVLSGIGAAMLYRVDGSAGGSDIIGAIIYKYYSISISTSGFIINLFAMGLGAYLFGLEPALYTLCAFYVSFKAANTFTDGFDFKRNFIIISEKHEAIANEIIKVVGRGVTYLNAQGAYTRKERKVIFVVVKLTQVAKLRAIISQTDPDAFVIIQEAHDVFGNGFSKNNEHVAS